MKESILNSIKEECKQVEHNVMDKMAKSYAQVVNSVTVGQTEIKDNSNLTLKEVFKSARNEEKAEEDDKQRRLCNIIIHGVKEKSEENELDERTWVKNLVETLHVKVNIKRISSIGKEYENKIRPILVALGNEKEKFNLIGNLSVLKGQQNYVGVSVTEDLTPEQRKSFKTLSDEAKAHNQTDGNEYILRVRGTSKNGFYLKKILLTQTP